MESVNEVKELGVQFTADLKPSKQSELAYNCVYTVLWYGSGGQFLTKRHEVVCFVSINHL